MTKKQTKKATLTDNAEVGVTHETVVLEETPTPLKETIKKTQKPNWEMKNRFYYLSDNATPLTCQIPSSGIYWFDEEKGYERELLLTRNQKTLFVDEMVGRKQPQQIVFVNGSLMASKQSQNLQRLLSLYHPMKNKVYREQDDVAIATDQVDYLEMELHAMNSAMNMDVDMAEAVLRTEVGSKVSKMSSKELKRDLLVFARRNPGLFLELANDDSIGLRNIGIRATEVGIIKLSSDQRTFSWGTNDRKLMTVPFDENPYSALASWFKTDEGMNVFNSVEKRLK